MPIYEFLCQDCRRTSDYLVLSLQEEFTPVCKRCGSANMTRLLSRVNVRLSEESRLERLADPSRWGDVDENDPKSVARMLKRLGPELGEDFPGEVDQMIEEAMESEALGEESPAGEEDFD